MHTLTQKYYLEGTIYIYTLVSSCMKVCRRLIQDQFWIHVQYIHVCMYVCCMYVVLVVN